MNERPAPTPALLAPIRFGRPAFVGETISLGASQRQQLAVREINEKEAFTLIDGDGVGFRASLQEGGRALVYEKMAGTTESGARITLVCSVLAKQRMLTVVQKATELGCVRIVPVFSDHGVKPTDIEKEKPSTWFVQAIKACRQCRRASVPDVQSVTPLASALAAPYWVNATERFWLDDRTAAPGDPFAADSERSEGDYALAVGPEGGWSDTERELIAKSAKAVPLGNRILRAETAVFTGLALLQHRLGDLR